MSRLVEVAHGGYVAVRPATSSPAIYRRLDPRALDLGHGAAHWFCRSNPERPPLTWRELTELGRIAYVGEFVDRSEVNA
ncbi:MAG: hypothetical protein ABW022_14890 [Actinoplanes sp.]